MRFPFFFDIAHRFRLASAGVVESSHSEKPTMQSLEILLDLLAFVFVLYVTYEQKAQDNLAFVGDISSIELTTPVFLEFNNQSIEEETTEDDGLPPWDIDEVVESSELKVPEDEPMETTENPAMEFPEGGLIPFDVDEPYLPSRKEVFDDHETTKELSIDVNQITAKKAWKAAKALGLPYKNPDRSRIKVTVLRENIETYLRENPSQISDVLPFVG